eukprot:5120603-Prymnesium_polylepis.1
MKKQDAPLSGQTAEDARKLHQQCFGCCWLALPGLPTLSFYSMAQVCGELAWCRLLKQEGCWLCEP